MPNQACPNVVNECLPCNDFPIENLSAEAPDSPTFLGIIVLEPPVPLGWLFGKAGCKRWCFSTVSQAAADECALQQAEDCVFDGSGPPTPGCSGGVGWCAPVPGDGYTPRFLFDSGPQQCSLECSDGTTFIFFLPAGAVRSIVSQADADVRAQSVCQQRARQLLLEQDGAGCDRLTKACLDSTEEYSFAFPQTGGSPPWTYALISGDLNGLTLSAAGVLSGLPLMAGSFPFVIEATDQIGVRWRRSLTLVVMEITTSASLPNGTVSTSYSVTFAETGGVTPVIWSVISGALPGGLTLNTFTGELSGVPTATGTFNFTIGFTDSAPDA